MPDSSGPKQKKLTHPQPWEAASTQALQSIRGICLDIDETLSTRGKLTGEAFQALWDLNQMGFLLVPITGRPAGWCDHIARFWPVHAVVGENGAFTFFMENGVRRSLKTPTTQSSETLQDKLSSLRKKIQDEFPDARWASDQVYREHDLAIDFCEDVPAWPKSAVDRLVRFCRANAAHAKVSSIHVNTWYGDYDKRKGFENWLAQGAPGCPKPVPPFGNWLYIGDSPNDEPMFEAFEHSVGVANLREFLPELRTFPTWITSKKSGKGFREMAEKLIRVRSSAQP